MGRALHCRRRAAPAKLPVMSVTARAEERSPSAYTVDRGAEGNPMQASTVEPRRVTPFGVLLALGYAAGLGAFLYYLAGGASYYLTPLIERARHPDYWTLKPGGSLGLRFGVAGLLMMTVMHVYSARKRWRWMRSLGPLRNWLNGHILLGILGPLFVVLHSSFKVGGLIAISFWSMVAVALSGIFGRYLYLQIPRTRAGEELTLAEVEKQDRELTRRLKEEFGADDPYLAEVERASAPPSNRGLLAVLGLLLLEDLGLRGARRRVRPLPGLPPDLARALGQIVAQKRTLRRRIVLWDAIHRLFHHWHVIHKPFAIVMYLFAVVHVAVATLTGYGLGWP